MRSTITSLLLVGVLAAACADTSATTDVTGSPTASPDSTPSTPTAPAASSDPSVVPSGDDLDGAWLLTAATVDGLGLDVGPDARIDLVGRGTEFSGRSACNDYSVTITRRGEDDITVAGVSSTDMACDDGRMDVEARYLGALERLTQFQRTEETLTLFGDDVKMSFTHQEPLDE